MGSSSSWCAFSALFCLLGFQGMVEPLAVFFPQKTQSDDLFPGSAQLVPFTPTERLSFGSGAYNKSIAWGQFFEKYPQMWSAITTALRQGAVSDMNFYYNQTRNIMRTGFPNPSAELSDSTPGYETYMTQVRKALVYLGLTGTTNAVANDQRASSNALQYGVLTPFAPFMDKNNQLTGIRDGDSVWPVGPNVCLSRVMTTIDRSRINPIKNVTYCTSSRDEARMKVVCWLPTLENGAAVTAQNYTTVYSCCEGSSLSPLPTSFPQVTPSSLNDLLALLDQPSNNDLRMCQ